MEQAPITASDALQFLSVIAIMGYGWLLYKLSRIFLTKEEAAEAAKVTKEAFERIDKMFDAHVGLIETTRSRADEAHELALNADKEASFANRTIEHIRKRSTDV